MIRASLTTYSPIDTLRAYGKNGYNPAKEYFPVEQKPLYKAICGGEGKTHTLRDAEVVSSSRVTLSLVLMGLCYLFTNQIESAFLIDETAFDYVELFSRIQLMMDDTNNGSGLLSNKTMFSYHQKSWYAIAMIIISIMQTPSA